MQLTLLCNRKGSRMLVPSAGSKRILAGQVRRLQRNLLDGSSLQAFTYLHEDRGLKEETIKYFELGVVESSDEDYGNLEGYLSIPYIAPCSMADWDMNYIDIRFRRGPDMSEFAPKYRTRPGHPTRIFNTRALANPGEYIAICEGEVDAMTLWQAGIPAVGIPGVKAWKPYYNRIFSGFERVIIVADGDEAKDGAEQGVGEAFAAEVAKQVPNPKVTVIPDGGDTNSFYLSNGVTELRNLLGIK